MSVQRDRINQSRINAGLTPLPETYTVRAIWEGDLITGDRNGLDYEDAADIYESEEKFYLNLPDSHRAAGTTLQMFRESDGHIEREITFP